MRRARIKVQATVPVRRKAVQAAAPTDSDKPPSTSNSISDVEKNIPEKDVTVERIENAPKDKIETEKPTESDVQLSFKSETQNIVQEKKNENREEGDTAFLKITDNGDDHRQSECIKDTNTPDDSVKNVESTLSVINKEPTESFTNKETDDSIINKETDDSIINKELNIEKNKEAINGETEVENSEINKQLEIVESTDGDSLNAKKQVEITNSETRSPHVDVGSAKHIQNRSCFMRPVPRLDSGGRVRKNSVQGSGASASESEDESRKSIPPRVRNDSVCSVQSNKDGSSNMFGNSKLKFGQQKRRLTVSESARKLAEARKEFMLKHENKTPDRSKLTMYDLIYYNPISNPMTGTNNPNPAPRKISVCSTVSEEVKEKEEEEVEDEPTAMPVPRVKVGPNGELIIDQESLIIERTEKEKNRSAPIVQDQSSGGFYKRRQKSKEWSKWDTLRFYKALSNIGTDFLLMQSFFPKRTRQELKLKFKKEERTNRELVEKALKYQVFDMEALKKEMEIFEEDERKETETTKTKVEAAKKQFKSKRSRCRFVVGSIEEIDNSCEEDVDDDLSSGEFRDENTQKKSKRASRRKRKTTISQEILEEEEGESTSGTEDTEIYNVKPTRSGRLPKRRKLQAPKVYDYDGSSDMEEEEPSAQNEKSIKSTAKTIRIDSQQQDIIANLPNMRDIQPGSLVILARESPDEPGKTVLQVYMVSKDYNANDPNSEQNMTPVNLPPEVLATVKSKISETEPICIKSEMHNSKE